MPSFVPHLWYRFSQKCLHSKYLLPIAYFGNIPHEAGNLHVHASVYFRVAVARVQSRKYVLGESSSYLVYGLAFSFYLSYIYGLDRHPLD